MIYLELAAKLITYHEAERLEPYQCSAGKWTWGIGRNLEDNPPTTPELVFIFSHLPEPEKISRYLLGNDLKRTVETLSGLPFWHELDDNRKAATVDFHFNLGAPTFNTFKRFIAAMNVHNYEKAGDELTDSRWFDQVGRRGPNIRSIIYNGSIPEHLVHSL